MRPAVIAPTHLMFREWCRQHDVSTNFAVYIEHPHQLAGRSRDDVVLVGDWRRRSDVGELLNVLASMGIDER